MMLRDYHLTYTVRIRRDLIADALLRQQQHNRPLLHSDIPNCLNRTVKHNLV